MPLTEIFALSVQLIKVRKINNKPKQYPDLEAVYKHKRITEIQASDRDIFSETVFTGRGGRLRERVSYRGDLHHMETSSGKWNFISLLPKRCLQSAVGAGMVGYLSTK